MRVGDEGMIKLWIFRGGGGGGGGTASQNWTIYFWALFLNILGVFLKVKIQNWNIFGGLLTFNYFWGYA